MSGRPHQPLCPDGGRARPCGVESGSSSGDPCPLKPRARPGGDCPRGRSPPWLGACASVKKQVECLCCGCPPGIGKYWAILAEICQTTVCPLALFSDLPVLFIFAYIRVV